MEKELVYDGSAEDFEVEQDIYTLTPEVEAQITHATVLLDDVLFEVFRRDPLEDGSYKISEKELSWLEEALGALNSLPWSRP